MPIIRCKWPVENNITSRSRLVIPVITIFVLQHLPYASANLLTHCFLSGRFNLNNPRYPCWIDRQQIHAAWIMTNGPTPTQITLGHRVDDLIVLLLREPQFGPPINIGLKQIIGRLRQ